jgi:predicted enzyme related to lactoylglutathione lyase
MNPVTWFEIPVANMTRAKAFYEFVFNLSLETHEVGFLLMAWFPMEDKGAGATGALVQAASYSPAREGVLIYFSVEDIDATLERVTEKGGGLLQSKTGIGEYGFVGYFLDSEGNRIGLHSRPL